MELGEKKSCFNSCYNKKAQLTIFIIIAIVIVAILVLFFMFRSKLLPTVFPPKEINANAYLSDCIEEDVESAISTVSKQGGSLAPQNYIMYNGSNIEYLCYDGGHYLPCVMQQPMLKQHIELEIRKRIKPKSVECIDSLKQRLRKSGYVVSAGSVDVRIEIFPKNIFVNFDAPMTLTKADTTITHKQFQIDFKSEMYDLIMISTSILNYEARYGDSETTFFMNAYPDIKVEKKKQGDGSTIYIVSHRISGDTFQFASRSVAWPAGYGLDSIR